MCKICDKTFQKKKMKNKKNFASIKGQLCLIKEHLGNKKGHVEVEYPSDWKLFLTENDTF